MKEDGAVWPRFFVWPDGRAAWRLVEPEDAADCTDMSDSEFGAFMESRTNDRADPSGA